jgi:hypothetical protein
LFGLLAVGCGTPTSPAGGTPATPLVNSRDQVAKAFFDAVVARDEAAILGHLAEDYYARQNTRDFVRQYVLEAFTCVDIASVEFLSQLGATPTAADRLNGLGETYVYTTQFAFRRKGVNEKWYDGSWHFSIRLVSGKWKTTDIGATTPYVICQRGY